MTPLKIMRQAVAALERSGVRYCLIGGHAASLYRSKERFTRDVDFALLADPATASKKAAEQIIRQLGMKPIVGPSRHGLPGNIANKANKASRGGGFVPTHGQGPRIAMVTSAPVKGELTGIIDILLPTLPWVEEAIERAQANKIDLGFADVPVITPEDLVVAKCYALKDNPQRFQDLDDLKEIFESVDLLDLDYVDDALSRHRLKIPEVLGRSIPKRLR